MDNNLQQLIDNRNATYELFHNNEVATANAIIDFIKMHCTPEGVEPLIHLEHDSYCERKNGITFSGSVEFITDDPERIAKGWNTDFGSDFDIKISENYGIEINKGTIGSYTLKDKYQVARDRMLAMIWDNHSIIVDIMARTFQIDLYNKFYEADRAVNRAEDDIKKAEEERKNNEALLKLKKAKYLCTHHVMDKYENDDYWTHNVIGKRHTYADLFIIDKVTDQSVLGRYEMYKWRNKRLELSNVIYQIRTGKLLAFEERPEEWIELNEGTSTN